MRRLSRRSPAGAEADFRDRFQQIRKLRLRQAFGLAMSGGGLSSCLLIGERGELPARIFGAGEIILQLQ